MSHELERTADRGHMMGEEKLDCRKKGFLQARAHENTSAKVVGQVASHMTWIIPPATQPRVRRHLLSLSDGNLLARFAANSIQPSCRETLGMNDYLNNWWANNSASTILVGDFHWSFDQALSQNDYFIVKNPGIDSRRIPIDLFDRSKLDEYGTRGPIRYDGTDSYGLDRANAILTVAIQKNWTATSELCIDAQSCQGENGPEAFDA
ncbi:hypothetical protein LY76DRAFT_632704 [Colletotrichum caudatum]|nr:hypothetical protein LY76DRAFT_632704 [Colletotrichum caudatum]